MDGSGVALVGSDVELTIPALSSEPPAEDSASRATTTGRVVFMLNAFDLSLNPVAPDRPASNHGSRRPGALGLRRL